MGIGWKGRGLLLAVVLAIASGAAAQGYQRDVLVPGSAFHGVHGVRMSPEGQLYAGSVAGQSLWIVDVVKGTAKVAVGPPQGMADDIAFGPGGQIAWTAISAGIVYTRRGNGPVEVLAKIPSVNSIAFSRDGKRLFAAQVFGGDDLFELDPAGVRPPRRIREKMGGFNSFAPGPDGWLYGPVWFKGQVAKVNPDTGDMVVVTDGLKTPAAAKFDSKNNLYVLDTATGELVRVDIKTGAKVRVAQLSTSLDNLTIDARDRIFVSNMADNGIQEVDPKSGRVRQVIRGALAFPVDIALGSDGGRETIYVADTFALRAVDAKTGVVRDLARSHAEGTRIQYPAAVGVGSTAVVVGGGASVQVFDRGSGAFVRSLYGFNGVADVLQLPDGDLLVATLAEGKLERVVGDETRTIIKGLAVPAGLAAGPEGSVYVTEAAAGRLSRVDLATGMRTTLAEGLKGPKGLAVGPDGRVFVLEVGARQVVAVDPKTGAKAVLAGDLPVGLIVRSAPAAGGVAVGASGVVYVASDVDNAIYRLTPR
jgi:sugar lactone lactonase YvrE